MVRYFFNEHYFILLYPIRHIYLIQTDICSNIDDITDDDLKQALRNAEISYVEFEKFE